MTRETKISLLIDAYDEQREMIKEVYKSRFKYDFATKLRTAQTALELNMWYAEETGKIETWFINSLTEIFEGAQA